MKRKFVFDKFRFYRFFLFSVMRNAPFERLRVENSVENLMIISFDRFRFWQISVLTNFNFGKCPSRQVSVLKKYVFDKPRSWHFPVLTNSGSEKKFILKLVLLNTNIDESGFDNFRFWQSPVMTNSGYTNFVFPLKMVVLSKVSSSKQKWWNSGATVVIVYPICIGRPSKELFETSWLSCESNARINKFYI